MVVTRETSETLLANASMSMEIQTLTEDMSFTGNAIMVLIKHGTLTKEELSIQSNHYQAARDSNLDLD